MKNLPIGEQDFGNLRNRDLLYVDKTGYIADLLDENLHYLFFARPRRFGKSLLTSTLCEMFSGNKELFEGLAIYDRITWDSHPVIQLDFSSIYSSDQPLEEGLTLHLKRHASDAEIDLFTDYYAGMFEGLIQGLHTKHQKQVVVLIDEYDKPIVDKIGDTETRERNRGILKNLFGKLKPNSRYLRFLFITGVSRFSKVSLFSDLNNLVDLTFDPKYSALAGYTQQELEDCFKDRIQDVMLSLIHI